jgi:hypothetical protein
MTPAQELLDLVKDMKPSANMERKPAPQPRAADYTGRMYVALPPKRVELPALGGCCEILYDWSDE